MNFYRIIGEIARSRYAKLSGTTCKTAAVIGAKGLSLGIDILLKVNKEK